MKLCKLVMKYHKDMLICKETKHECPHPKDYETCLVYTIKLYKEKIKYDIK